jgi:formylglycine-generating enzyme
MTGWGHYIARAALAVAVAACGQAKPMPPAPVPPPSPPPSLGPTPLRPPPEIDAGAPDVTGPPEHDAGTAVTPEAAPAAMCPAGMIFVETSYCPHVERKCLEEEFSPQNNITICHKFAPTQKCLDEQERRRFCIDEYEYPNQKGAHPPWMVSWYDAQATCASLDKRLCYESEWVAACEGPDRTPFPYGYARDNKKCNIDNQWIKPSLPEAYSKDPAVALKELSRLDQSVPSGTLSECVSGFGVRDMTGNFDEWVTGDKRYDDKSEWAGLKGGAWGHVRNACRPVTTSHPPDFTYYFIAFRCCKDAPGGEPYRPSKGDAGPPAVDAADRAPIPSPAYAPGPSSIKVAPEHWPRPKGR